MKEYCEEDSTGRTAAARKKILRYLTDMDRSEGELREKLSRAGFSEEDTEDAIAYAKSYGYIDDGRFAVSYIRCKKDRKSRMEITAALREKEVSEDLIREAFLSFEPYDEVPLILRLVEKRLQGRTSASYDEIQKCRGYLYRKGFRIDDISVALNKAGLT